MITQNIIHYLVTIKCQKILWKIFITKPEATSLNLSLFFFFFFFCPTNSPKPKNSAFTVTNDKEKQQILTHKKLEPVSIDYLTNKLID